MENRTKVRSVQQSAAPSRRRHRSGDQVRERVVTDGRWAASDGNVRPSSRGGLQVQRGIIIDTSQRRPDRQTDRQTSSLVGGCCCCCCRQNQQRPRSDVSEIRVKVAEAECGVNKSEGQRGAPPTCTAYCLSTVYVTICSDLYKHCGVAASVSQRRSLYSRAFQFGRKKFRFDSAI